MAPPKSHLAPQKKSSLEVRYSGVSGCGAQHIPRNIIVLPIALFKEPQCAPKSYLALGLMVVSPTLRHIVPYSLRYGTFVP